jgi:hypothetical protein
MNDLIASLNPSAAGAPSILPDSRARSAVGWVASPMGGHVPIYCANCGVAGGMVPEENMTFAFWLCKPCFATHGEITNTMVMPDEVFWEEVKHAQLEKHGHTLNAEETRLALADPESLESRLARDRGALTPHAGS